MAVTKLSDSRFTSLNKYDSFAAGNTLPTPGAYEAIATFTPTTGSSITFTSIPQTYKHLRILGQYRDNRGTAYSGGTMYFNGDTSTNYSIHYYGYSTSTFTGSGPNYAGMEIYTGVGGASGTNKICQVIIDIADYTNTNIYKTAKATSGHMLPTYKQIYNASGNWRNTSAVTSITLTNAASSYVSGSRFTLYGIKG